MKAVTGQQVRPELVLQTGHRNVVKAVAISPDGRWVATGSLDTTIRIWDPASGRELRAISADLGAVRALAASPDGKWLASGSNNRAVSLWNVETGAEERKIAVHAGSVNALAFSPDGGKLAIGGSDEKVRVVDPRSGAPIFDRQGHTGGVTSLAFSRDGVYLASGGADRIVRIWVGFDAKSKSRELKGNLDEITALRFSDDGRVIAAGSADASVRLWRLPGGNLIGSTPKTGGKVVALSFTSATDLVIADRTGTVRPWSSGTKSFGAAVGDAADRDVIGEAESAAFSYDGSFLVFGNEGGTASVVTTASGNRRNQLESQNVGFYGIAFSSDRKWMAAAGFDNTVKLWDIQTGQCLAPLRGHTGRVNSVVFHPDNRRVISAALDSSIRVWDVVTLKTSAILSSHTKPVTAIALGHRGRILVSGSEDETIGIWDLDNPSGPQTIKTRGGEVTSVAISPDEKTIASASLDGKIRLWDRVSLAEIRIVEPGTGQINSVEYSPDGKMILSAGTDGALDLWDASTGTIIRRFARLPGALYSVLFSPDGKQIVSTGRDRIVRRWNVADGREISSYAGHSGTIFKTAFVPDRNLIASASEDGSIMFWNVDNGEPVARVLSMREGDDWLVVTPQGFFDGSPASSRQISWRFEGNTFAVRPVEEFFSEFWLPGLLFEVLNGKIPPGRDISTKDRRQPSIRVSAPGLPADTNASNRFIRVKIDIINAPAGAKDVRLFRNGSLTRVWRDDVMKGQPTASLEATVAVTAGENRFTAYAFNSDDIKSSDHSITITGSPNLARPGTLYLLSVGVNSYANPAFDLRYAVADSNEFVGELAKQQSKLKRFAQVETISIADKAATKAGIQEAIARLSAKVLPEDGVVMFFAGHGFAFEGAFYVVPHDLGYQGDPAEIDAAVRKRIAANSLSSRDLELAVEGLDAGQILLVIDACNSGQAIESDEVRRGPMNSKGLAQLAYEKGMYILTASQGFQAAKEDERLGHGYLTYTLIEEGLKSGNADRHPADGQVMIREWLDFAAERVPQIDAEELAKENKRLRKLDRVKSTKVGAIDAESVQRPRVFYRREADRRPLVVAGFK